MTHNVLFKQTREELGLTKEVMAKYMGLSLRGYEELEAGRVDAANHKYFTMLLGATLQAYTGRPDLPLPQILKQSVELLLLKPEVLELVKMPA